MAGKRFIRFGWILLMILLAFGGCQKKEEQQEDPAPVAEREEWKPIQVLEHAWKGFQEVQEDMEPWHPEDYHEGFGTVPEKDWRKESSFHAWTGDVFYELSGFNEKKEEGNEYHYLLMNIDTVTMKETKENLELSIISPEAWGEGAAEEKERAWKEFGEDLRRGLVRVISMDTLGERIYLFLAHYDKKWNLLHYYCLEMGVDQTIIRITDFAPLLFGEKRSDLVDLPRGFASKDGEICFVEEQTGRLELFKANGEVKARGELPEGYVQNTIIGRAQDGTPVFQADCGKGQICFFTPEAALWQGELKCMRSELDEEGGMYLWQNSSLIRWNVETGEARKLSNLNGFTEPFCMGIRKNSKGQIVLAYDDGDGLCFYRYEAGGEAVKGTLRIAAFFTEPYIESCAADYERTHPGIQVEFVSFENPFQNATSLNRLAEECKAGKGPDLIRFSVKEHVESFQSAGCLAPLDGMLSEETKKGLFQCVLELGKVEDGIYGMPTQVVLECFMTSKNHWPKDSWTIRDVMECFETRKERETDLKSFMAMNYPNDPPDSQTLLNKLCMMNLDDSPFVDVEKGKSYFSSKEFQKLLRFCKECADEGGASKYSSEEDIISQMREGNIFVYWFAGGLVEYSKIRANLGKDFASVGLPSENGSGFIAESYDYLTVNAFSENQELAADFMEYMLSERCQIKYGTNWVRRDVIESRVRERVTTEDYVTGREVTECHFVISDNMRKRLAVDEDGNSFVKEYVTIMDNARPYFPHAGIREIISEETDAYFKGAKTAEEVAGVIHRRVQLFLDEQ